MNVSNLPCGTGTPCTVTVQGTTLEQPPSQPNGGGFNSSMSAGTVTLGTPLANGASVTVQFLLGIQQTGNYKVGMIAEGLPAGGNVFMVICHTDAPCVPTLQTAAIRRCTVAPRSTCRCRSSRQAINHNPRHGTSSGSDTYGRVHVRSAGQRGDGVVTEGTAAIGVITFAATQ